MSNNVTRTFLIPEAKLADQFGLTETVGSLPEKQAQAFVADVRAKLATCAEKQMGTEVERVAHADGPHRDLTVWHVTTEISDEQSVRFLMGIVRDGTSIAQVGFVPGRDRRHAVGRVRGPRRAGARPARRDARTADRADLRRFPPPTCNREVRCGVSPPNQHGAGSSTELRAAHETG